MTIATITGVICKGVAELQGCLSETIIGSLIYIPLALLMLAVSLPLVIHFGAEKGRYIAMVMWINTCFSYDFLSFRICYLPVRVTEKMGLQKK